MVKRTLLESISDRPSINFKIERELKKHDPAMQTRILDALEAVKDAGPEGISVKDWATRIRMLHPDEDHPVADLLRAVVGKFGCCIERLGDKRYGWVENDNEAGAAVPQGVQDAMGDQVRLTSIALKTIRELGEFTLVELASAIARKTGMPISSAVGFAQHIIKQFIGGTLATIGNDRYKVKSEQKKTSDEHVDDLKDLLRKSGLSPDEINEAAGIGGGISGTKFSKGADNSPAVGAGVRSAVNNVTLGAGKYAKAAVDYGIKNAGSLAGMSDPTSWETEVNQEYEKDRAAQQEHPTAWWLGDKLGAAASALTGGGIVGATTRTIAKSGSKIATNAAEKRAAELIKRPLKLTPDMRAAELIKRPLKLTPDMRALASRPATVHEAGGIGGGMSRTKFSKAADYAPAVGAGVRGAVDNITLGTGKYARAAADYSAKNLGSLAGISEPTTWDTEINQEREKDLAAQRDHPTAWDIGDKAATVAQVASGVGAVKALGTAAIKAGAKAALRAGERRAALAALPKSGTYGGSKLAAGTAAKKAAADLKYQAMLMSNAELATAIKTSRSPELMRELERRLAIEKLPDLPVVNDFQLGTHMPLKLTPQMRTTQSLKLTPQMRVAKNTLPPKLAPQPTIPSGNNVIPFRPRTK